MMWELDGTSAFSRSTSAASVFRSGGVVGAAAARPAGACCCARSEALSARPQTRMRARRMNRCVIDDSLAAQVYRYGARSRTSEIRSHVILLRCLLAEPNADNVVTLVAAIMASRGCSATNLPSCAHEKQFHARLPVRERVHIEERIPFARESACRTRGIS